MKGLNIYTKELAQMAGVRESELVYAMQTDGYLYGVKIPDPVPRAGNRIRAFRYEDALLFANSIKSARYNSR
ncbi:hypothetical protein WDK74_22080 [Escherichia coli]